MLHPLGGFCFALSLCIRLFRKAHGDWGTATNLKNSGRSTMLKSQMHGTHLQSSIGNAQQSWAGWPGMVRSGVLQLGMDKQVARLMIAPQISTIVAQFVPAPCIVKGYERAQQRVSFRVSSLQPGSSRSDAQLKIILGKACDVNSMALFSMFICGLPPYRTLWLYL